MKQLAFTEIALKNFLSFGPDSDPVPLQPLNVLIGPNGSGKSNFIESFELLRATPADLAGFVRQGGGAAELAWKGPNGGGPSCVSAVVNEVTNVGPLRYHLEFTETAQRLEVIDEVVEEITPRYQDKPDVYFYYRFQRGHPVMNMRQPGKTGFIQRNLRREDLDPQQSVLSQRRDPDLYPEVTGVAQAFSRIAIFREWSFGRQVPLRQPQPADLPTDVLLPDLRNLGLVLNDLEHSDRWKRLTDLLRLFLPRFSHLSTRIQAGHVQLYVHEDGLRAPIPATRLSDGTIRFIALLAVLVRPETASLICIEEPELGLHPDAVQQLASLLVDASKTTQLVITTHSDVLVSALTETPESVLVTEQLGNATHVIRLEAEKLRFWLDQYALGEIWRIGQLGGNP